MSLDLDFLNQQITHAWPFLVSQITHDLQTSLAQAKLGPLSLSNVEAVFYLDDAPGYSRFDLTNVSLTAPLNTPSANKRWSLQITGYLNGDILKLDGVKFASVINEPFTLTISNFQVGVTGEIDPTGEPVPHVKSLKLALSLDIEMHSRGKRIFSVTMQGSAGSQAWTPVPGHGETLDILSAEVKLDLGPLVDQLDTAKATATLTFNPSARPAKPGDKPQMLKLTNIKVLGGIGLSDVTIATPPDIADYFQRIGAGTLPIVWPPEGSRPDPHPALPGAYPLSSAQLRQGAMEIELATPRHAPHGCVFNTTYGNVADSASLKFYWGERDSAIWTGHYLAAEAFHYAATAGAERQQALTQASAILTGIEQLFQVPEMSVNAQSAANPIAPPNPCDALLPIKQISLKGLMCRAVLPQSDINRTLPPFNAPTTPPPGSVPNCFNAPQPGDQAKKQSNYYSQGVTLGGTQWFGFGRDNDPPSRDQLIGVMLGLGCAYKLIDDAALRARIKPLVSNALAYLIVNNWHYPTPAGPLNALNQNSPRKTMRVSTSFQPFYMHQQLAFLIVGKMVDKAKFGALYDEAAHHLSGFTWFPIWTDCLETVNHYFKYNLHFACMALLMFLETDKPQYDDYMVAMKMLRKTVGHHRNAYFNLLWILAQNTAQERQKQLQQPAGYQDANAGNVVDVAQETRILLSMWLERRRLTSGPNGLPLQKTPWPTYLRDLFQSERTRSYSAFGSKPAELADFPLPVDKRPGLDLDFMWQRSPFLTDLTLDGQVGKDCPDTESPGVDYLLAYWLAAYLQVV